VKVVGEMVPNFNPKNKKNAGQQMSTTAVSNIQNYPASLLILHPPWNKLNKTRPIYAMNLIRSKILDSY
jgi:hypothetical protein